MDLIIASGNQHKAREISEYLNLPGIKTQKEIGFDIDVEETGQTFMENALIKAHALHEYLKEKDIKAWVLADDSGLEVDALDKRPGIYSARYPGVKNPTNFDFCNKILEELKQIPNLPEAKRTGRFVCALALISPQGKTHMIEETIEGLIAHEMRGLEGFGYDPIFFYPPFNKTTAEIPLVQKNTVSHRGKALQKLKNILSLC
jgi:XTP/dITP diphosphohydrolase